MTLAKQSGVSEPTIKRLEAGSDEALGGRPESITKIVEALEAEGAQFIDGAYEGAGGPGVRLRDR
jgi:transcriptional regulator with XRE-family HTH domain